jgi:hypothetical protein
MISAMTPTSALAATPRFDAIADDRWTHWHAALLIWLQTRPCIMRLPVAEYRAYHRRWLASLLARSIPLRVIRRLSLDDPRESEESLESRVALYLKRSAELRDCRPLTLRKEH